MNDLDTTIKALVNSAVDRELSGHRSPPQWDGADSPDRARPARPITAWKVPLLAAAVAGLLVAGSVLAIDHSRDDRSNQARPAGPTPSASITRSVSTDPDRGAREYAEAVAVAAPDPGKLAGISIGALPAADAARLKDSGALRADPNGIADPRPGKPYTFTMSYLAGPSQPAAVVSLQVQGVASGSCPPTFLARGGYTYRIRCQVTLTAGAVGTATLTARTPAGVTTATMVLTDPGRNPASPSVSASLIPEEERAAPEYSEAVARAPEASKMAGVSDRPATAEELQQGGEVTGVLGDGPIAAPDRGRSYPITLLYIPASNASLSVLAVTVSNVTAARCPGPFRTRPAHAYVIHCQVTFRAGVGGTGSFAVYGPRDRNVSEIGISTP